MRETHPALEAALEAPATRPLEDSDRNVLGLESTTSESLARALAVGCLSRMDPGLTTVNVWDPTAGTGYAGSLLVDALRSSGREVQYRGQEIIDAAAVAARTRFKDVPHAEIAHCDTLAVDASPDFNADLVIVDAPWGLDWQGSESDVEARRSRGEYRFGLPKRSDSVWLFISLALEKLRSPADGGGRVAALVTPNALRERGATAAVRQRIVEEGVLESVTRLPDRLALATGVPLYLLTFTNQANLSVSAEVAVSDLQTEYSSIGGARSIPASAFRELELKLRTRKPGPRTRIVPVSHLMRTEAMLTRQVDDGETLTWRLSLSRGVAIDARAIEARYGSDSGIDVAAEPSTTVDLDPGPFFARNESRELLAANAELGWDSKRLSQLVVAMPALAKTVVEADDHTLFIPFIATRAACIELGTEADRGARGPRGAAAVRIDSRVVEPSFLAAWLSSEQGIASRQRAMDRSVISSAVNIPGVDPGSLMRWIDEIVVPVPDSGTQLALVSADKKLESFGVELVSQRQSIWASPADAPAVVSTLAAAFDPSIEAALERLPYPIATALWAAVATESLGEKQKAYIHAWEAIVAFHASVLLSALRCVSDDGAAERDINRTLRGSGGMERATFNTWVVIAEKASKELRDSLERNDPDEVARVRRAFADLDRSAIERLISKNVIQKFVEARDHRNRWDGHTGRTPDAVLREQIATLEADLAHLRQLLGNVWTQLLLVRAGTVKLMDTGAVHTVELAIGTRAPFRKQEIAVGDGMTYGELYLVREGAQSPLRLPRFVQLRESPRDAQFTTYFYSQTEGDHVRMVSYQFGSDGDLQDDLESFRGDLGGLMER